MERMEPELGQMMHGNPMGAYACPEFVDALVDGLLNEIERVHWNVNQEEWDRYEDPGIKGVEYRPYQWTDDQAVASLPNLKFDFSPQEIRWYKYPGRGSSATINWGAAEWAEWFERALSVIRAGDTTLY